MLIQLKPLIDKSIKRSYAPGSTIYYQGEIPRSASILLDGVVRVFSISSQGDEQIVTYHMPGEIFPSSYIFGKSTSTMFFYESIGPAEICLVPRLELLEYIKSNENAKDAVMDYYTTSFAAALLHINALEQPKARDKLLYILFYLCQRYGKTTTGKVNIPFTLTHQNLASIVGLTRETTATEMNKLKKDKVLSYASQKYIINVDKLIEMIGEDSFKKINIGVNNN